MYYPKKKKKQQAKAFTVLACPKSNYLSRTGYLKLNGVNAKEHAVFKELARMKGYFEKLAAAEKGPEQRTMVVDKQAAARFIRRGISSDGK